jgi:hypothetical protein
MEKKKSSVELHIIDIKDLPRVRHLIEEHNLFKTIDSYIDKTEDAFFREGKLYILACRLFNCDRKSTFKNLYNALFIRTALQAYTLHKKEQIAAEIRETLKECESV